MTTCKKCNNCAWYCHSSNRCYVQAIEEKLAIEVSPEELCDDWSFDGLGDQEREDLDTLVTMEKTTA